MKPAKISPYLDSASREGCWGSWGPRGWAPFSHSEWCQLAFALRGAGCGGWSGGRGSPGCLASGHRYSLASKLKSIKSMQNHKKNQTTFRSSILLGIICTVLENRPSDQSLLPSPPSSWTRNRVLLSSSLGFAWHHYFPSLACQKN